MTNVDQQVTVNPNPAPQKVITVVDPTAPLPQGLFDISDPTVQRLNSQRALRNMPLLR